MKITLADILRLIVMVQMVVAVIGIGILISLKRVYYTTKRRCITFMGWGIVGLLGTCCGLLMERVSQPLTWRTIGLGFSSLLIEAGVICTLFNAHPRPKILTPTGDHR